MDKERLGKVIVGQKWQDWDSRFRSHTPRVLTVLSVTETHAVVESNLHKITKIRLDRFKENSTGYKLLETLNG